MSRKHSVWNLLGIFLLTVALWPLLGSLFPPGAEAAGIVLRPPFDGTYCLTTFFDHHYPDFGQDNEITIYTGESVTNCNPHCYQGHNGYDWAMGNGTPVLAPADGVVVRAQWWGDYGNQIVINHSNVYYTMYGHLQGFNVGVGQVVKPGDLIGWSDNTGTSTGPHLHFTVWRGGYDNNNYATDPFGWRGSGTDPLLNWPNPGQGRTAECLWRGLPGDGISCFDRIVEDHPTNAAGWSQGNPWTTSTAGNGSFVHYTDNWDPPWSWARWDSTAGGYAPIRYHGYYRVSAFIAAIANRTTNARYTIHYYPSSTTTAYKNQSTIADNWTSLGTYEMERDDTNNAYVYLDDYTGEPKDSHAVVADAMKFSAELTYVPTIKSGSGWTTYLHIRNLGESLSANVTVNYYNGNGTRWGYINYTIAAKGTQAVTPSGFSGSAVVVSDQDVAVIVRREKSDEVAAYTGVSEANWGTGWGQPGVEISVPTVFYNPYWGNTQWKTTLHVQNAGSGSATFRITYYNRDGTEKGYYTKTLSLNGSADYVPSDWGDGYEGAAYIHKSNQPLAVVVTQEDSSTDKRASQYNAFSSGANTVYLVSVMRAWYGWTSSFTVQNVGTAATNITVKYYGEDNPDKTCTLTNLQPHASCIVVQDQADPSPACPRESGSTCDVPAGWQGAVVMTATQPIVAIVNQQQVAGSQHSHQSYSGFVAGGSTVYGPFAANCWTSGGYIYRSSSHVQNVGKVAATISTQNGYCYDSGSPCSGGSQKTRAAGKVAMFYLPVENLPASFKGSVKVTRDASVIAAFHNYARGLSSQACAAPAGELDDYGASYNMPQR